MDGLLTLLILYLIFKTVKKKVQKPKPRRVVSAFPQKVEEDAAEAKACVEPSIDHQVEMDAFAQAAVETVSIGEGQSHATLDTDVYGKKQLEYMGSLQADTNEGECLCEPELSHRSPVRTEAGSVYENEIGREPLLDFSPEGLYQGIVMSEILARPSQCQRRFR